MMGMPDAWEQQVLLRFSAQVEQGENPAELTFYEVVQEPDGHHLRFMKAIDTKSMCLACHGAARRYRECRQDQPAGQLPA